jgi:hypothetical protein
VTGQFVLVRPEESGRDRKLTRWTTPEGMAANLDSAGYPHACEAIESSALDGVVQVIVQEQELLAVR